MNSSSHPSDNKLKVVVIGICAPGKSRLNSYNPFTFCKDYFFFYLVALAGLKDALALLIEKLEPIQRRARVVVNRCFRNFTRRNAHPHFTHRVGRLELTLTVVA